MIDMYIEIVNKKLCCEKNTTSQRGDKWEIKNFAKQGGAQLAKKKLEQASYTAYANTCQQKYTES